MEEEEESPAVSPLVSFWIEFNQFFSSFTKLYVFHKAGNYSCHRSVSDMRVSQFFVFQTVKFLCECIWVQTLSRDTSHKPNSFKIDLNLISTLLDYRMFLPHLWWYRLEAVELRLVKVVLSLVQLISGGFLLLHQSPLPDLSHSIITLCYKGSLEKYNHHSLSVSFFMQISNISSNLTCS